RVERVPLRGAPAPGREDDHPARGHGQLLDQRRRAMESPHGALRHLRHSPRALLLRLPPLPDPRPRVGLGAGDVGTGGAMSLDDLPARAALPDFHVSAPAPAEPHENKIHEDDLARQYGFKGGLVPGVIMYAWMTHPVVEALGAEWLEHGSFETRFAKPIYYEEPAIIRARVSARTAEAVTLEVAAHNSVGEVCGTATMSLDRSARPSPPVVTDYVVAPLPAERPRATRALFEGLGVLGTPELDLDVAAAAGFVTRF